MNLSGKKVLITGANGGLGRVVSNKVLELGGIAILVDLAFSDEPYDAEVTKISVDLTDREAVTEAFSAITDVDVVMNLAGGFQMGEKVYDTANENWDFLFKLNVTTVRNVVSVLVPKLLEKNKGAIVNVGAFGALSGQGDMGTYCASKSVVMRLTESLSAELKANNINVNAVLPSIIDTPPNRQAMPDANFSDWVSPTDLANVICFLASDAAGAVHGALVPVTGKV